MIARSRRHPPIDELLQTFTEDVFCIRTYRRRRMVAAMFDLAGEFTSRES